MLEDTLSSIGSEPPIAAAISLGALLLAHNLVEYRAALRDARAYTPGAARHIYYSRGSGFSSRIARFVSAPGRHIAYWQAARKQKE